MQPPAGTPATELKLCYTAGSKKGFWWSNPSLWHGFRAPPKYFLIFSHLLPAMSLRFNISIKHSETAHTEQNLHASPPGSQRPLLYHYGASPVLPLPSFFLDALLIVARNQTLLLWVSNLLVGPKCCTCWKWAHIIDWWDIRKPSVLAHVSLRSQW